MADSELLSQVQQAQALLVRLSKKLADLSPADRELLLPDVQDLTRRLSDLHACAEAREPSLPDPLPSITTPSPRLPDPQPGVWPAAARVSMQFLKPLLDQVSDGVIVYDRGMNIQMVNQRAVEYCGYDPTGTSRSDLMAQMQFFDEETQITTAQMPGARVSQNLYISNHPYTVLAKSGQYYRVLVSAAPILTGGEQVGSFVVWHDVTEQAHLRKENRLQTELLQAIFQADPSGLVVITVDDMTIQLANQAYQAITCDPTVDPVGKTMEQIWSKADAERAQRHFREIVETGESAAGEYEYHYADGALHRFTVHLRPIHWDHQPAILMVHWDVTQLKQAIQEAKLREEQLLQSEARFRAALSNGAVSVFSFDRDLRFTWLYEPTFGELAKYALGRRLDEIQPPDEVAEIEALKRSVIETGQGVRREIRSKVEGAWRIYDTVYEPLRDSEGNITGLSGAVMDITEQRRLEDKQAEHHARIELHHRLVDLREKELQQIAHDIHNGPLQSMISLVFTATMAEELSSDPLVTEIVHEVADRARQLVGELRMVSNALNPPAVNQIGLMRAIEIYVQDLENKHPHIHFHLDLMEDLIRLPDAVCLAFYRIFQESLTNAVRHAQASDIWVSLRFEPGQSSLQVKDNGKGFVPSFDWMELVRRGHFGIVSMKEHAESAQAALQILSTQGGGTEVRLVVMQDSQFAPADHIDDAGRASAGGGAADENR